MSTALTTIDWKAMAQREEARAGVRQSNFLSTRGGVFRNGETIIGTQIAAVVVDSVLENAYYAASFDPASVQAPTCYAFGETQDDMAPSETLDALEHFERQSTDCATCDWNKFGSRGKGKACKNQRRLALISAGTFLPRPRSNDFDVEFHDDPEYYRHADLTMLKLPVTSTKAWNEYVSRVVTAYGRPTFGVVTRIFITPDPTTQYRLNFEAIDELPDNLAPAIIYRHQKARDVLLQPYTTPNNDGMERVRR